MRYRKRALQMTFNSILIRHIRCFVRSFFYTYIFLLLTSLSHVATRCAGRVFLDILFALNDKRDSLQGHPFPIIIDFSPLGLGTCIPFRHFRRTPVSNPFLSPPAANQ